jgi:hypothetical protein
VPRDSQSPFARCFDDLTAYRLAVADPALRGTYGWERQAEVLRDVYEELIQGGLRPR